MILKLPLFVMGVSGSGKSTLAKGLADRFGAVFLEADEFHPPENVARMAAGQPLNDAMRRPWLKALGEAVQAERVAGRPVIATCSALKRSYRDQLRGVAAPCRFLFLDVPQEELAQRMAHRRGHYMPASLLKSQLDTLEVPGPGESDVITQPGDLPPGALLDDAVRRLSQPG